MNLFDRFISFFSPVSALRRQSARNHLRLISGNMRKYEGASKSNRLSLWNPGDSSASEEVRAGALSLRQRARELRRNNPYAHRIIQVITTNVVGTGIKPVFDIKNKALKKFFTDSWKSWADKSTECDFDDFQNLQGIQSMIMDAVVESGECFIIRKRQPKSKNIPLKLQILEADFLDSSHNEDFDDGRKIRQGIEFSSKGKRIFYHFYKTHPGETPTIKNMSKTQEKVRVPANMVIHAYEKKRPGQIRGVTFLHPIMVRLKDLDIFQDASLKKQQVSACYSAFLYNSTGESLDSTYKEGNQYELLEKLDSGTIEELPPGFDIKFADPPNAEHYPSFIRTELLSIATGAGITYETLTGDYSNVNFSSGRMGFLEFQRNIKRWQNQIMITQCLQTIFMWFVDSIQFSPKASSFNITPDKISVSWTTPAREMIDPSKEIPAYRDSVKAGFKTLSGVIRSMGDNPDEVFKERAEEIKELKELGVSTDSDPSLNKQNKNEVTNATQDEKPDNED